MSLPKASFGGGFFRGIFFGVGLLGVAGDASTRLFSTLLLCAKEHTNAKMNTLPKTDLKEGIGTVHEKTFTSALKQHLILSAMCTCQLALTRVVGRLPLQR